MYDNVGKKAISELLFASVSKRVLVHNHSYGNESYLHDHCLANQTHFHMKGCAPGLGGLDLRYRPCCRVGSNSVPDTV